MKSDYTVYIKFKGYWPFIFVIRLKSYNNCSQIVNKNLTCLNAPWVRS